ncbi:MAG: hypothetical protein IKN18_05645, partial [Neisseriaceae bacterium]|nr:hypothetical protein [Neisseriaceae bacterium]
PILILTNIINKIIVIGNIKTIGKVYFSYFLIKKQEIIDQDTITNISAKKNSSTITLKSK